MQPGGGYTLWNFLNDAEAFVSIQAFLDFVPVVYGYNGGSVVGHGLGVVVHMDLDWFCFNEGERLVCTLVKCGCSISLDQPVLHLLYVVRSAWHG